MHQQELIEQRLMDTGRIQVQNSQFSYIYIYIQTHTIEGYVKQPKYL